MSILSDLPDINFINDETVDDVVNRMLANYAAKYKDLTGETITLAKANPYRLLLYSCAMEIYQAMQEIDFMGKQNYLKYARGGYLDNLAAIRGVTRKGESAAITTLRFTITSALASPVSIPQGCLTTNGNGIYFATDEYAEISVGELYVDVPATCTVTGTAGTGLEAGTINTVVNTLPYVVTVSNTTMTIDGTDEETDDELRERAYLAPDEYATTGTAASYIYKTKQIASEVEDVIAVTNTAGVVDIYFTLEGGVIPDASMIALVQERLDADDVRALTDTVIVHAPTAVDYDVEFTYYIARSDAANASEIQTAVQAAVASYTTWQTGAIGRSINPQQLIRRVIGAGVKRLDITSPAQTAIGEDCLARTGNITITYGGIEDD